MMGVWLMGGSSALGQFAPTNAVPAFMNNPTSAMGIVTGNTLVLTSNPNGFVVSGQVAITIPPGPSSGILVQWTVVRRIEPFAFSASGIMTNTILTGFSAPPIGTFANTSGSVVTDWRFMPGGALVGGSQSTVPMSLVNGVDSPAWAALTANSGGGGFTWTGGIFTAAVMQQQFTLFGNYTGGPGGVWVIDVPVTSEVIVPLPLCPADIAPTGPPMGDGTVNVQDLLAVIGAWGPCADPDNCPADIAPLGPPMGDDLVNVQDLLAVIGAWGACR
jgi:hypothetical protein